MIRHGYYSGIAASVVLLLCSAMSCLALLCPPPTSSSSLLVEKRQCCLNRLSGPAINKGRDCKQPLFAGRASSPRQQGSQLSGACGLGRNDAGEGSSAPLEVIGLGWAQCLCSIHSGVKTQKGRPWLHEVILKWEQGDKGCTSRDTPITYSSSELLLIPLDLVKLFFSILFPLPISVM